MSGHGGQPASGLSYACRSSLSGAETQGTSRPSVGSAVGGLVLVFVLWMPRLIDQVLPLPLAVVLTLCALLVNGALDPARRYRQGQAAVVLTGIGLLAGVAMLLQRLQDANSITSYYFVLVLLPGAILGAGILADSGVLQYAVRLNLLVASAIIVPLTLLEGFTGHPLLAESLLVEDGRFRATVGEYHPIINGVLLSITILTVTLLRNRLARFIAAGWLFAGVVATYSQGPLAMAGAALLLASSRSLRGWVSRRAGLLVSVLVLVIAIVAFQFDPEYVAGSSISSYSTNYRGVLLAQIPRILATAPLGFGLGNPPSGLFIVYSDLLGYIDLNRTFDSELVLWTLRFGALGALLFIALIYRSCRGLTSESWLASGMLLLLLLNGLTVAIYSWLNVGLLMAILIGQEVGAYRMDRRASRAVARGQRKMHRAAPMVRSGSQGFLRIKEWR